MLSRRLPLKPPRHLPWPLKPLASAQTELGYDRFGRMVMHIRHALLTGVTPAMVAWWFRHIGGDIEIDGIRLNRYLVWHPLDHIHWELVRPGPDGGAGVGAQFRIVEAFGRNPAFYVDVIDTVAKLDDGGITLIGFKLGIPITSLRHDFIAAEGGTRYVSTLTIGTDRPVLRDGLNPFLHKFLFPEAMGRAWLRHNVEEVGLLEHMIPRLHPARIAS